VPSILYFGGDDANQILAAGSGVHDTLGYFGAGGFGFSVPINTFQSTSFSTDSNGASLSGQVPNLTFASTTGAFVAGETSARPLSAAGSGSIQMSESTLHIQFDSTDIGPTQVQNIVFRATDQGNISANPSGVDVFAFELKGNSSGASLPAQYNTEGDSSWTQIKGSGNKLGLDNQLWPSGIHNFYVGTSARPTSLGAKKFSKFFALEFLSLPMAISFLTLLF